MKEVFVLRYKYPNVVEAFESYAVEFYRYEVKEARQ